MNRNQQEAMEAAEYDMQTARRAGKQRAMDTPMKQDSPDGCGMAQREQTTGELRAIMDRRQSDNRLNDEHNMAVYEALRNQSERDAARIHFLEVSLMEANGAMEAIRNGLRYMQGEWRPLIGAMFERQEVVSRLADQIENNATLLARYMEKHPAMVPVVDQIASYAKELKTALLNEKPKLNSRFYCPTCKRHVAPEDVQVFTLDDGWKAILHVVDHNANGPVTCSKVAVETRGIDRNPHYLASVDAEFARLGATRTEADAVAIETCRADGVSPAECARALYEEALARASAPKDTQTSWNIIQGAWMQAAEKSLKESLTRFREYAAMVDQCLMGKPVQPEEVELVNECMSAGREPDDCAHRIDEGRAINSEAAS